MATNIRMLVNYRKLTDLPVDSITNTLYFQWDSFTLVDIQNAVNDLWTIYSNLAWVKGTRLEIKAYDMADDTPRPIKAEKVANVTGTNIWGNREPAVCLSYYADRNLPRQRGRIYCGPFQSGVQDERPGAGTTTAVKNLGIALAGLGGENVSWRVHSVLNNDFLHIRHIWVDNAWDTVRKRGVKANERLTADV